MISLAMPISRIIPILSILLLALHGAGVVRTLHSLSHHAQPSIAHTCNDATSHSAPQNHAPSEHPSDSDDDHDCDLCLTLNSFTPIHTAPQLQTLAYLPKDHLFGITAQTLPYSPQQLDDHAARAPPIC